MSHRTIRVVGETPRACDVLDVTEEEPAKLLDASRVQRHPRWPARYGLVTRMVRLEQTGPFADPEVWAVERDGFFRQDGTTIEMTTEA